MIKPKFTPMTSTFQVHLFSHSLSSSFVQETREHPLPLEGEVPITGMAGLQFDSIEF